MTWTPIKDLPDTTSGVADGEEDTSADNRPFRETHPLVAEGFIITHSDETRTEQRQKEFRAWLDQAIAIGLAEWERQL